MNTLDGAVLLGELAPGREPAGAGQLTDLKRAAAARFTAQGLPTPALENWKYTPLSALSRVPLRVAVPADADALTAAALAVLPLATDAPCRLVVVNGALRSDLCRLEALPRGLRLLRLADHPDAQASALNGMSDTEAMPALNSALMQDGIVIDVAPGTVVDEPLHVVLIGHDRQGGILRSPRIMIDVGHHARLRLVEEYLSHGADHGLTNAVTEIRLADGAELDHHRLQTEDVSAGHIGRLGVRVGRDARFLSDSVVFGGNLTRIDIDVRLGERGGSCRLNGLFVGDGEQHIDHHTRIDHVAANTHSEELYRGILDGRSRGVFNGKVIVHQNAQQISARQASNNLLLSRQAEIDTKPELEIYADDVACAHGATVGDLDLAALFYLRSRGVAEPEARALLTYAFAEQVVRHMPMAGIRRYIERRFLGHANLSELIGALDSL